jgi:hypothetical protein
MFVVYKLTETFGMLSLFRVMQCYSYSKIIGVIINCNSAWRIPNKSSVKSRTHNLFAALPGKHATICTNVLGRVTHTVVHADMDKTVTQAPLSLDKVRQHLLSDSIH